MAKIPKWTKQQSSPKVVYTNDITRAKATVLRSPSSWRKKWYAIITIGGYPIWGRAYETKAPGVDRLRDELHARPEPVLDCTECGTVIDHVVLNERNGDAVKYHFDCPECGHEGSARWVPASAV